METNPHAMSTEKGEGREEAREDSGSSTGSSGPGSRARSAVDGLSVPLSAHRTLLQQGSQGGSFVADLPRMDSSHQGLAPAHGTQQLDMHEREEAQDAATLSGARPWPEDSQNFDAAETDADREPLAGSSSSTGSSTGVCCSTGTPRGTLRGRSTLRIESHLRSHSPSQTGQQHASQHTQDTTISAPAVSALAPVLPLQHPPPDTPFPLAADEDSPVLARPLPHSDDPSMPDNDPPTDPPASLSPHRPPCPDAHPLASPSSAPAPASSTFRALLTHSPPIPSLSDLSSRSSSSSTLSAAPNTTAVSHSASDTQDTTSDMDLTRTIYPLLRCPMCSPARLLRSPLTLHCGHTVCAEHLAHPASASSDCPLPSCTRPSPHDAPAFIHPDAHVSFVRANAPSPSPTREHGPEHEHRVDVKVNKILDIVQRAAAARPESQRIPILSDPDEYTDSEDEGTIDDTVPVAGPSTLRRRSPSPSPSRGERPRKRRRLRRRHHRPPTPTLPSTDRGAELLRELKTELVCEICFALMWQPVTTPCQHTFCAKCLQRALDHNDSCPLCREKLPGYVYFQEHSQNKLLLSIILQVFPGAYEERGSSIQAEERDARLDTPIFVCQLSFPGMPTLLHLYEPRYRLMLRRCLETPHPCFGMVPPPRASATTSSPGNEFGTMLEIRNVQMLPDGRSVVETWGSYRFRIMERGVLDGYMVGRVERVDDYADELVPMGPQVFPVSPTEEISAGLQGAGGAEERDGATNDELMTVCREFVDELKEGTPWVRQHLVTNYVAMPEDPAEFSFWMAPLIPIEDHEKAKLLPIRSPRLRLRLIVHWIEQLKSHWWFSGGCVLC